MHLYIIFLSHIATVYCVNNAGSNNIAGSTAGLFNVDSTNPSFSDRIISNSLQSIFPPQNPKDNGNVPLDSPNGTSKPDSSTSPPFDTISTVNTDDILDNQSTNENDSTSETQDEEPLRPKSVQPSADLSLLTNFRHFARRTVDGRLCAAAFIQDDQTYTDCTNATAPDGSNGIEWCYVEVQLINKNPSLKDWAECEPPTDYDRIRSVNAKKIVEKFEIARQMTSELQLHANRLERYIAKFNNLDLSFQNLSKKMQKLNEFSSKSHNLLNLVKQVGNGITLGMKQIENFDCQIRQALTNSLSSKFNCKTAINDNEQFKNNHSVNGIVGTYYQGHGFNSNPLASRLDKNINFYFFGPPIDGLSPFVYSIKWSGYIMAPHTGHFIFKLFSNGHAKVIIEDKQIIELTPGILSKEIKKPFLSDEYGLDLIGGNVYPIEVDFVRDHRYHKLHSAESVITLFWKSRNLPYQPIPHKSFVSKPIGDALHMSLLDGNNFEILTLDNGTSVCFKAGECNCSVIDVPQSLFGQKLIRINQLHKLKFTLRVNIPSLLYVIHKGPFPLTFAPDDRINTMSSSMGITYYKDKSKTVKMNLTAILLLPGKDHQLYLINTLIDKDNLPSAFIARPLQGSEFHPHINSTLCGPDEILTLPNGRFFSSCNASSYEEQFDCEAALSNKFTDTPLSMWHTKTSKGAGEYIEIYFKKILQIRKLVFKPRDNPLTWPSKIVLYSKPPSVIDLTDETVSFNISHTTDEEFHHYKLPNPIATNYVRIEIGSMYLQEMETGGSFALIGGSCHEDSTEDFYQRDKFVNIQNCGDSAESVAGFPWEPGSQLILSCPICTNSNIALKPSKNLNADYSIDSPPCVAAQQFCMKNESECRVLMLLDVDGFSVMKLHQRAPQPKEIKILFGAVDRKYNVIEAMKMIQKGYYADQGQLKTQINDLCYGWLQEAELDACRESEGTGLVKYGIKFPKAGEGWECLIKEICKGNYWSIDLENGTYDVTIFAKNLCTEGDLQEICLQLNHKHSIHKLFPANSLYKWTTSIKITDKILVLSSYCQWSDAHTVIQSIIITPHTQGDMRKNIYP